MKAELPQDCAKRLSIESSPSLNRGHINFSFCASFSRATAWGITEIKFCRDEEAKSTNYPFTL